MDKNYQNLLSSFKFKLIKIFIQNWYYFTTLKNKIYETDFFFKASNPKIGPMAKIIKIKLEVDDTCNVVNSWILIIVIAKPIQFTIVKAVPLFFEGAFFATNVENSGESAITTIPQKIRKIINSVLFGW